MKLAKLGWYFFYFSTIVAKFCKVSVFIEKRKTKEKKKSLYGFGSARNEAGPIARV
jgi:hypothetical protein